MVYQEMLSFPNLTVTGNIFAGREIVRGGRLLEREMRAQTRAAARATAPCHRPQRPCRVALGGPPAAAAGGAGARVRLPHPRPRRTDRQPDRCRNGSPLRGTREAEEGRDDAPIRVPSSSGGLPTVQPHHGAQRWRLRRHVRSRGGDTRPNRRGDGRSRAAAACGSGGRTHRRTGARDPYAHTTSPLRRRLAPPRPRRHRRVCSASSDRDGRSCSKRFSGCFHRTRAPCSSPVATVRFHSAREAARAGIVLVPEERQRQGLFFNMTLRDNLMLPSQSHARDGAHQTAGGTARGGSAPSIVADQGPACRCASRRPEWRQSAEGRPRQVVGDCPEGFAPGRTDEGRGRRREIRDSRDHPAPGGRGRGVPRRVQRPSRSAGPLQPDRRHARGTHSRRTGRRRGQRGTR